MIGENDMVVESSSGPFENRSVSPSSTIPDFVSPGASEHRQSVFDSSSSQMQLDFGDPPLCATVEPLRPHFREGSFSKQMAELRLKKDLCEVCIALQIYLVLSTYDFFVVVDCFQLYTAQT